MTTSTQPDVVVSGYGTCTPLGNDWPTTRDNLLEGRVGYEPEKLNGELTSMGRVDGLPDKGDGPRYHRLALKALDDLERSTNPPEDEPLGIVATSSKGGLGQPTPETVTGPENPGVWSGKIARKFPNTKYVATPNTACATGLSALIQGARWLADGSLNHAVILTSESCFYPLLLAGYQNLNVLCDDDGMRPFHPDRSGFALSEGAAALYLTTESFSKQRELPNRGEILGWGETCDAHHMTSMKTDGSEVSRAINLSLQRAGLNREHIDLLHAHLTTTETNDAMEGKLLESWHEQAVLQGIKPSLGHTIGAAGLLEVIATVSSLESGRLFPLPTTSEAHLPNPDLHPENQSRSMDTGLSWNMGFGGHNAATVIGN